MQIRKPRGKNSGAFKAGVSELVIANEGMVGRGGELGEVFSPLHPSILIPFSFPSLSSLPSSAAGGSIHVTR